MLQPLLSSGHLSLFFSFSLSSIPFLSLLLSSLYLSLFPFFFPTSLFSLFMFLPLVSPFICGSLFLFLLFYPPSLSSYSSSHPLLFSPLVSSILPPLLFFSHSFLISSPLLLPFSFLSFLLLFSVAVLSTTLPSYALSFFSLLSSHFLYSLLLSFLI